LLTERELKAIVADVLAGLGHKGLQSLAGSGSGSGGPEPGPMSGSHPAWSNPDAMTEMIAATPARIAIGRAGARYDTDAWLQFRMDHAAAKDAIFHEIGQGFVDRLGAVALQTQVADRRQYLVRPDLGRRLLGASEQVLREQCRPGALIQLLVVDGLSGTAVEANAIDFIRAFQAGIQHEHLTGSPLLGTPIFVRLGRVAVMDQIGEVLRPDLIVELIGERPGLVTAESMSAYFCYKPDAKSIESDRTLISNIHKGGIPAVEAGAHSARLAARILAAKVSGVKLGL